MIKNKFKDRLLASDIKRMTRDELYEYISGKRNIRRLLVGDYQVMLVDSDIRDLLNEIDVRTMEDL